MAAGAPTAALVALVWSSLALAAAAQKYNAIFNFGDSITDTGNLCTNGRPSSITFTQPPYGETYFGTPTCRCSDGRVVVDFLSALAFHSNPTAPTTFINSSIETCCNCAQC